MYGFLKAFAFMTSQLYGSCLTRPAVQYIKIRGRPRLTHRAKADKYEDELLGAENQLRVGSFFLLQGTKFLYKRKANGLVHCARSNGRRTTPWPLFGVESAPMPATGKREKRRPKITSLQTVSTFHKSSIQILF
jgi:hypothetical protein